MSRNPGLLVELLLDLLPLNQSFIARDREPPATLVEVLARIQAMIRYLRLGDGMISRFNGAGIPAAAGLGIILAYGDASSPPLGEARASGYARLARAETIVVADVGSPPPLFVGGEAQAGCLSFEMSSGRHLIFVNGGMPGGAAAEWTPAARATASHNTLCIAEQSSSKLVAQHRLKPTGDLALRQPDNVTWRVENTDGGVALDAEHDGYQRRFGVRHGRRLQLAEDGARLEGRDHIHAGKRSVRFKSDLPFAIHFHLYPDVSCCLRAEENEVELSLPGGELWRFTAKGAALTVEESTFFANSAGSRPAMQIVLRGATFGDSEINWAVERVPKEVPA
jgi:uncharacterized heparinase superfamily protein